MLDAFIQRAKQYGITNLPGMEAQRELISTSFDESRYRQPKKNSKKAGVLAIILTNTASSSSPSILYTKRTTNVNDKHSGQISFPGGQFEPNDETLLNCALRETKEEVGLNSTELQIIGPLTQLYVHVSDFIVQPYLAIYESLPKYILEEEEVANVIEFPISTLMEEHSIKYKDVKIQNYTLKQIPYFDLNGETLWGATAMVTNEILHLIRSSSSPNS